MKNYTLRSLCLTLAVVLFSALPRTMNAQVNCATFTTAGTPAVLTPTSTFQTVTTQSGRFYTFTATAGCTYTFSHCQGGGSIPVGTDPALTLTDASNVSLAFNDDGVTCLGGSGSEIVWTCPANGTYRIHHEKCCCTQAGAPNFATMGYKVECPCDAGVAFASPGSMCVGGMVTLTLTANSSGSTLVWQQSTDNVNFNNITNGFTTPFTYGPLSVTTYFRAIVTCTGVGNTVGNDTTASVQVIINPLPTVIFPPQASPLCCNSNTVTLTGIATPTGGTYSGTGVSGGVFTPNMICNGTSTITYTYTDGNGCTNTATQPYAVNDTPAVTFPPLTPVCYSTSIQFPLNTATPPGGTYTGTGVTSNIFVIGNSNIGTNVITYTYTAGGCTSKTTQGQIVYANPLITITPVAAQCNQNTNCAPLTATPVGGTWSGSSYIFGNTFCPLGAPQGNQTITYTFTDGNGCTSVSNANVLVEVAPNITWNSALPNVCENNNLVNLNGYAQPGGGTYSGIGVNANQFNPASQCTNSPVTITYTATTTSGCLSTSTQPIVINCIPTVTFSGPVPPICVGSAPVNLAPYVSPAGGQFSGTTLVTTAGIFTPTTVGNYNITYQYLDLSTNCSNSTVFQVQVVALPNVNIPFLNYPDVCEGSGNVLLNGSGTPLGGVYSGTGVVGPFGGNYYFNPVLAGADTFMIHYTYTTTGGCGGQDSASIIVHPGPVINFPAIADVCDDDPLVQLLATPVGGTFYGTNVNYINPNYYFNPGSATPGNYTITYRDTNQVTGCYAFATQNIIVKPRPGNITISNLVNPTSCGANNGSYRINGLAPNTNYILYYEKNSVLQGPYSIVSSPLGTYTVTNLTAATYANVYVYLNGCAELIPPAPFSLIDPNAPAAPTAGSNSPLCQFGTLQLTATSVVVGGTYTWAGPGFGSNQQNPVIFNASTTATGNYTVTVTNNLNCTSLPTTIAVVVNPAPNLTISSNAPVCAGNTLTLTASSTTTGTSFAWDGPAAFFAPTAIANRPNMAPVHQGWYHSVATAPNGCIRTDSILVNVGTVTPLTPTAGSNSPVCSGGNINLTATNSTPGSTYQWTGPSFTSTLQNPTRTAVVLADSGDYTVQAFLNGCNSGTSTVHVQVIQSLSPNITITANPDDTVCFGTNIDFTSVITDGGSSPIYQWYRNGIPVIGAIDSFWGSPYLTDLDTIYCVLVNATTCTTAAADTSNKIAVHMSPNQIPTVTVGSYPFAWVLGQNMTYYANVLNAGTNPTYQWYLNGNILVGETGPTYTSNALISTDVLSVTVTSNAPCATPNTASGDWNAILSLSVNTAGQVVDDLKLYPNPNNGTFNVSGSFGDMTGVKDGSVEVLNAVGQVVFKESTKISNGKIDKQVRISDIAAGVYIIRVSADGKTSQLRFVVTK